MVEDLVSHLCTSDARYRATVPAEDHFLSLEPTSLTVDLLEQHLLAAETSAIAVGAARGTPRPPFFEGCSPSPLAPSYASAAAADVPGAEDVGAASASAKRRSGKGKGNKGGGGGSASGGGGSSGGGGGSGGGGSSESTPTSDYLLFLCISEYKYALYSPLLQHSRVEFDPVTAAVGVVAGVGVLVAAVETAVGVAAVAAVGLVVVGLALGVEVLEVASVSSSSFTCGKLHTQHRCFSRLDDAWRGEFGDDVELPRWADLLRSRIAIFDLEFDAIVSAMYALSVSAEGDFYGCVLPAPHFLWPFAVGDASVFRVRGSRAFVHDPSADKLSSCAIPNVFPCFVPDAPGWQFYHPTSRRVLPSHDVMFDESVLVYRLCPYRSAPLPPPPLFLAPGPPPVDPLPPQGPAPSGVSQVDPPPGALPGEVAVDSGAARGTASGGAELGGAELGGAALEGTESGGAEPQGAALSGGSAGAPPRQSPQQLREWFVRRARLRSGATGAGGAGAGGAGVATEAGVTGGTAATSPRGARTRDTGAAVTGGVGGAGAGDPTESGAAGAGGSGAGGAGAGGARVGGTSAGGAGVGGTGAGGAGAGGAGVVDPGGAPESPLPAPSPYTEQSGGLIEHREPASRPVSSVRTSHRVPRSHPPPVPGTHAMTLRPSFVPLRVLLPAPSETSLPEVPDPESDRARAASPTVSRLLATAVTGPSFESAAVSALLTKLLHVAAACRLDYASALIAESLSASPPSVGGECALGMDVLEDRQEDFEDLAAAVPCFASMLLAPEGDPDAPDIPTLRSYAEAITGPYSPQCQAAMDAKLASWKSIGTYVDEVPPPRANIVDGMWIFRVKRPPSSPPSFKARYVARGFSQ
ncbi:unnamed protein product [Closterium sp. NIES-54]